MRLRGYLRDSSSKSEAVVVTEVIRTDTKGKEGTMKHMCLAILAAIVLAMASLTMAEEKPMAKIKGSVHSESLIKELLLSPRDAENRPTGPPISIAVNLDGTFNGNLPAGNYRIGSNPPCIKVSDLTFEQVGGGIRLPQQTSTAGNDSSPGTFTKVDQWSLNFAWNRGPTLNVAKTNYLFGSGGVDFGKTSLTDAFNQLSFPSLSGTKSGLDVNLGLGGGVQLMSEICEQKSN